MYSKAFMAPSKALLQVAHLFSTSDGVSTLKKPYKWSLLISGTVNTLNGTLAVTTDKLTYTCTNMNVRQVHFVIVNYI